MPDTELMDRVLAIITEVPVLHDQGNLACALGSLAEADAERELSHAPAEVAALVPDCGSAHCVAGWVLVLRGYRFDTTDRPYCWVGPDGRLVSRPLLAMAAEVLGIPPREAYDGEHESGIFWEGSSVEAIQLWVDFYKGKIDRDDLEYRLARPDA